MIRPSRPTLIRLAAGVLAFGLAGAAMAAPALVIGRKPQPAAADLIALESLRGLPGLTQERGLALSRAFGPEDEDCLAHTAVDGARVVSCLR